MSAHPQTVSVRSAILAGSRWGEGWYHFWDLLGVWEPKARHQFPEGGWGGPPGSQRWLLGAIAPFPESQQELGNALAQWGHVKVLLSILPKRSNASGSNGEDHLYTFFQSPKHVPVFLPSFFLFNGPKSKSQVLRPAIALGALPIFSARALDCYFTINYSVSNVLFAMAAEPSLIAKCTAEFLGTFLLVFTVVCNVTTGAMDQKRK